MSYTKEIFINVSMGSTRVAILENEVLVELHIDIADHKKMVGNIYKGKVQNVIPGMRAAFIDIGYDIDDLFSSEYFFRSLFLIFVFDNMSEHKFTHISQINTRSGPAINLFT